MPLQVSLAQEVGERRLFQHRRIAIGRPLEEFLLTIKTATSTGLVTAFALIPAVYPIILGRGPGTPAGQAKGTIQVRRYPEADKFRIYSMLVWRRERDSVASIHVLSMTYANSESLNPRNRRESPGAGTKQVHLIRTSHASGSVLGTADSSVLGDRPIQRRTRYRLYAGPDVRELEPELVGWLPRLRGVATGLMNRSDSPQLGSFIRRSRSLKTWIVSADGSHLGFALHIWQVGVVRFVRLVPATRVRGRFRRRSW